MPQARRDPERRSAGPLAVAALALALAGGAAGQDAILSGPAAGQVLFHTYCASCHGIAGDGNGPVSPELRTPPADLTRLGEKYGLPLPRERLAAFVDGRTDVAAHGPREMPVWGERFFRGGEPEAEPARERARRRSIEVILDYLESLQTLQSGRAPQPPSRKSHSAARVSGT